MRIVFLGTSPFAVPTLERLTKSESHTVLAVVTQPDRPSGRGGRLSASAVKVAATAAGIEVLQPEKVRARDFVNTVRAMEPDVLVVAAFGQLISQRLLDVPSYGGINVHGSLLPRWRGAAPMQYALLAGDSVTGVTTMQMDAGLDTGDILLQAELPLRDGDNLGTIEGPLAEIGANLLISTLDLLARGECPRVVQDPLRVTHSPSLPTDAGEIEWTRPARDLHNQVRGLTPRPGTFGWWQGKRLKIWRTGVADGTSEPGVVQMVDAQGITVGTGSGLIRLIDVQPESRAQMPAAAWARGARLTPGQSFDPRTTRDE
ncbi:MAG: methionyl-tRNA formyltransferase [Capsulimonadaceae bacterium]